MTSTTQASDSSYFIFVEFLSAETMTTIDAEMQRMWHWTAEPRGLPPMRELLKISRQCRKSANLIMISSKQMYHKVFCGRKFKLGCKS